MERKKLIPILHLPEEELTEILSNIAKRVTKVGWEFMLACDHSFVVRYPDVVQRQNMVWDVKNQHRKRKVSESSRESSNSLKPPRSPPRRRHSRTMSCSSDNESNGPESDSRARRTSGGGGTGGGRRRSNSRSGSEPTLLGVPSKVES